LDAELVRRQLAASRTQAAGLIEAGRVLVGGVVADKPARMVSGGEPVVITGAPPRFVSRGGDKLEAGLAHFGVDPSGRDALDAGASTGGFTDCLLAWGAAGVTAVDVGRGQLHERLRADRRVRSLERTDIRQFAQEGASGDPGAPVPTAFDLVVADLSFISIRSVAAALVSLAAPEADLIVLVKPQFEAGRREVSKGKGVIREPAIWRQALNDAICALEGAGATNMGIMVSPLRGADGNVEFLVHLRTGATQPGVSLNDAIDAALAPLEREREREPRS
jgi:23S rRNA (cytidine1920-2'-O)/16S rRNA (cytidine1409-2'-O)-methyltransferase